MDNKTIISILEKQFPNFTIDPFCGFGVGEDYLTETNIRYLNYLLSLKRQNINLYLWNVSMNFNIDKEAFKKVDKSYFTKDSLNFLYDYIKAIDCLEHTNIVNLKNTFQTERLLITAGDKKDAQAYYNQVRQCSKKDVDYLLNKFTTNLKYHYIETVYKLGNCYELVDDRIHITFVIKLKNTNEMIGIVQFFQTSCNTPEIGYFIFENFRNNGYATEALSCLLKNLSQDGFKYPASSKYKFVIKEKIFKPSIIRATPNARNTASIKLLKKVGFVYSGTSHQQRIDPYTKEKLDVEYYYLEPASNK